VTAAFFIQTTVTVSGSRRELVTCNGCGQRYDYVAKREGWGGALSVLPFYLKKRVQRKALERAEKHLTFKLERAIDPVPCPYCGILQANVIRPKRHEKAKLILLLVGVIVANIFLAIYQSFKIGRP
jgi:hypothetical protein